VRGSGLLVILALASACAAKVFVPPTGGGVPATNAADVWKEATTACADVKNVNATLRVALRQGRLRSPGLTVAAIATSAGQMRLEDSTMFAMAGTAANARLVLRQDRRYVDGRAEDIVDAFVGARIGPERLLAVLTGCFTQAAASAKTPEAVQYGSLIEMPASDGTMYLKRVNSRWHVTAGTAAGLVVEFRSFDGYWPMSWRATSTATASDPVMLDVTIEDRVINDAQINPAAFQVTTPAGATKITLEDLRANGPLRKR
jgi:outer membrane biogenesis lipoprotein LolB